jgi:hypothetical protein
MNQPVWLNRPAGSDVDIPEVGDRATLHFDQTYRYMVTVEVTHTKHTAFTGNVVAIFDRDNKAQLRGGDVLSLVGNAVSFLPNQVMAVARKPAR